MAKRKKVTDPVEDIYASIALDTGGDLLSELDPIKGYIDTGNLAYNYVCSGRFIGGGIPRGRITEIFGPSSSGKSLVAANIIHGTQKFGGWAVLLDVENACNADFMERVSHINLKRLIRYGPEKVETLEKCFLMIANVTRAIRAKEKEMGSEPKPIVIIYDSIAGSPCERELRETELPFDYTPGDWKKLVGAKEQPGERAKICSKEFRKLTPMVAEHDVALVVLNQVREKIGVLYGSPETTAGGGKALEFYSSLRVRMQAKKKIEDTRLEKFAGINLSMKNVKNRIFRPFVEGDDIKLYFEKGVDPLSGVLLRLFEDERVNMKSAGNWEVLPPYLPDGVEEYKFKASKTENTMKRQVLLDCPKLLGVETTEEVENYLKDFETGMAASESDQYEEKSLTFDRDGNPVEDD